MNFFKNFEICDQSVGYKHKSLIIAEGGVNHFGNFNEAKKLIDLAKSSKCDVFKTQHFKTNLLIGPSAQIWRKRMISKELSNEKIYKIYKYCKKISIPFLCTPHDDESFEFLNYELKVDSFKIGSGELNNWPFIKKIALTKKPVIVSTGMYSLNEIKNLINLFRDCNSRKLAILHCVTQYPAQYNILNLRMIANIKKIFNGPVGYSDHTDSTEACLAAITLGSNIIEKHITIKKNVKNAQDWRVSCDKNNLPLLVNQIRNIETALKSSKKPSVTEEISKKWALKSITAGENIQKGDFLSTKKIIIQRPGIGLAGKHINKFLKKRAKKNIKKGKILSLKDIK